MVRKGEINYLPEFPEGMDIANFEAIREVMVNERRMKTQIILFLEKTWTSRLPFEERRL